MAGKLFLWALLEVFLFRVGVVCGTGAYPDQGFFVVANLPQIGRKANRLYLYAIDTNPTNGEVAFQKERGLPSNSIQVGVITNEGLTWGCFLCVVRPRRYLGLRFGRYDATFTPADGSDVSTGHTFVKPKTRILNTRGVFTVTVYPDADGSTTLADVDPIGVAFTPGCRKIRWCKGRKRNINTGPRLRLTNTDDGGVYTIRRPRRGNRGWFAMIEVIVATCPEGYYDNNGVCTAGITCLNGGVLRDKSDECICPPFLVTDNCGCSVIKDVDDDFVLGDLPGNQQEIVCRELPGGNPTCKGHLFCFHDLYGCKCSSGWYGNACDRPCPKGRWGADCRQRCPSDEPNCSRFFGPSDLAQPQDGGTCTDLALG